MDVWSIEAEAIANLKNTVVPTALSGAVKMISDCKLNKGRILTTGAGTSGIAARKIAHTFCCIDFPSFFLSPVDGVHGGLGVLQRNDVVIALSKGGGSQEIVNLIPAIKSKSAQLIAVTGNETSQLALASDIVLKVAITREADPFNLLATASTISVIAVFDAIAVALMVDSEYTRKKFAVIHPGGAVGERLKRFLIRDAESSP